MAKKMISEGTLMVVREFIGDNWSQFLILCSQHGIDEKEAEDIYEEIGGEN